LDSTLTEFVNVVITKVVSEMDLEIKIFYSKKRTYLILTSNFHEM